MEHPEDRTDQDRLAERCRLLEAENRRLRDLLAGHGISDPETPSQPTRAAHSAGPSLSTTEKIALFRSLFRGRDDVYAQRWENPDGRSGYSPRTERDWKAYYAAKPDERKRVDRETRKHIPLSVPLSDEAIHAHLSGKVTLPITDLDPL